MKYICMKDEKGKLEVFTFPRTVNHDCMAEALGAIKNTTGKNWHRVYRRPVSAGFVGPTGTCFGVSESLGLKSRGQEDTDVLARQSS